jgi:hypothetical protein
MQSAYAAVLAVSTRTWAVRGGFGGFGKGRLGNAVSVKFQTDLLPAVAIPFAEVCDSLTVENFERREA